MTSLQDQLVAHWIKYMSIHPEYIADAIKRHFAACPWDEEAMRPTLTKHWKDLRGNHNHPSV